MKLIYDTNTGELAGPGSEGILIEAPYAMADIPSNYEDHPMYFWIWNGVDTIVLKTGAELIAAQEQQKAEVGQAIIDKHARADAIAVRTVGKFEENGDIINQVLLAVMEFCKNGTAIPQALYDQYIAYHAKVNAHWCVNLLTMTEAKMDKVATAKGKARTNAQNIVNDPDWPYAS